MRAEDALVFEVDERAYVCSASAAALPPLHFVGAGKFVARKLEAADTMPTATAVVVIGFRAVVGTAGLSSALRQQGFGGRNGLHDAVHGSAAVVRQFLDAAVEQILRVRVLAQQDSQGRTPFFVAMSRGDVHAATAIRAAAVAADVAAESLLAVDFYGTPPVHALLGLLQSPTTADVSKTDGLFELASDLEALHALFGGELGEQLLRARDGSGHSVLECYVVCGGKTTRSTVLRELLAHFPVVVTQCIQEVRGRPQHGLSS